MRRTTLPLLLIVVASSCARAAAPGEPREIVVRVDGSTSRYHGAFLAYFPDRVQVRPGDTVVFEPTWTGEPHTVTLGTLVDAALAAHDADPAAAAPAMAKLPRASVVRETQPPPSATQPCVLESGEPPLAGAPCAGASASPAFNGRQAYYGSGFLADGGRFRLQLADDTAPGTYRFFCSFHGPAMSGALEVAPADSDVASPSEVRDEGSHQLDALVESMRPDFEAMVKRFRRARVGEFPFPAAAGMVSADGRVLVREFVPFTIKARVGERVTWSVSGTHTIAFKPSSNAGPPAIETLSNGSVVLNPETFRASRSPEPPAASDAPVELEGEARGRDDRHASGLLQAASPGRVVYALTFTDPGSHEYRCLIHPQMSGLVTVSL